MAEQVVRNYGELADAVANANIDIIYLGADIELTAPITIPANKLSLLFDGRYEDVIHRFTDMNSNLSTNTLNISGASSISLTFQNMTMTGRNYYGIPYISDLVNTSGVTVTYRNINYTGPQLAFNALGLTHFENVDITISPSNVSTAGEVGEVCRVEFAGNNIIRHNSTTDAVFWFRGTVGTAYFRLLPNAALTVNSANYFMYNYYIFTLYPVAYEIQTGASFILNSNHGISYNSSHIASSFLVDTGATFRYIQQTTNGTYASLYVSGGFVANQNANVYMQANFAGAQPLLYCPSSTGALLNLNNPKSFVLYNSVSAPIAVAALITRSYSILAEQLNRWTAARAFPDAGTFIDIPQNKWNNGNWAAFTVNGNITSTTTTAASTGLVNPQTPITNFSYQNARVISAGTLTITPDPVIDNGRPITGLTEPNASLIVSFTVESTSHSFNFSAGEDGRFEIDPQMAIPTGTIINISVNTPFLIKTIETTVISAGEVRIESAPEHIVFRPPPVFTDPLLLRRVNPEESVAVVDNRPYLTQWELLVSISGPLKTADGEVLENAVVFKDNDDILWDLSETPIVVYTGDPRAGSTEISWPVDRGILVRVTQPIHSGVEYSTQLIWTLKVIEET